MEIEDLVYDSSCLEGAIHGVMRVLFMGFEQKNGLTREDGDVLTGLMESVHLLSEKHTQNLEDYSMTIK